MREGLEGICANGGLHPEPREMLKLLEQRANPQKNGHVVLGAGNRDGTQICRRTPENKGKSRKLNLQKVKLVT